MAGIKLKTVKVKTPNSLVDWAGVLKWSTLLI